MAQEAAHNGTVLTTVAAIIVLSFIITPEGSTYIMQLESTQKTRQRNIIHIN